MHKFSVIKCWRGEQKEQTREEEVAEGWKLVVKVCVWNLSATRRSPGRATGNPWSDISPRRCWWWTELITHPELVLMQRDRTADILLVRRLRRERERSVAGRQELILMGQEIFDGPKTRWIALPVPELLSLFYSCDRAFHTARLNWFPPTCIDGD